MPRWGSEDRDACRGRGRRLESREAAHDATRERERAFWALQSRKKRRRRGPWRWGMETRTGYWRWEETKGSGRREGVRVRSHDWWGGVEDPDPVFSGSGANTCDYFESFPSTKRPPIFAAAENAEARGCKWIGLPVTQSVPIRLDPILAWSNDPWCRIGSQIWTHSTFWTGPEFIEF